MCLLWLRSAEVYNEKHLETGSSCDITHLLPDAVTVSLHIM